MRGGVRGEDSIGGWGCSLVNGTKDYDNESKRLKLEVYLPCYTIYMKSQTEKTEL